MLLSRSGGWGTNGEHRARATQGSEASVSSPSQPTQRLAIHAVCGTANHGPDPRGKEVCRGRRDQSARKFVASSFDSFSYRRRSNRSLSYLACASSAAPAESIPLHPPAWASRRFRRTAESDGSEGVRPTSARNSTRVAQRAQARRKRPRRRRVSRRVARGGTGIVTESSPHGHNSWRYVGSLLAPQLPDDTHEHGASGLSRRDPPSPHPRAPTLDPVGGPPGASESQSCARRPAGSERPAAAVSRTGGHGRLPARSAQKMETPTKCRIVLIGALVAPSLPPARAVLICTELPLAYARHWRARNGTRKIGPRSTRLARRPRSRRRRSSSQATRPLSPLGPQRARATRRAASS